MNDYNAFLAICAKRRRKVRRLREQGWTLAEIAKVFGITRLRVFQLLQDRTP